MPSILASLMFVAPITLVRERSTRARGGATGVTGDVVPGAADGLDQRFPEVARNVTDFDHLLKPALFLVRALILNRELTDTLRMVHFVLDLVMRQILRPMRTSDAVGAAPLITAPNFKVTVMFTLFDFALEATTDTTDGRFATFFEKAVTVPLSCSMVATLLLACAGTDSNDAISTNENPEPKAFFVNTTTSVPKSQ